MMHCIVKWDVLGKDGSKVWGAAVLLASVQIENGICSYGFAPHLRQKLYNPDMYARLDLDLQKRFGSKYALALWEICTDYLGAKRDYGETPWMALEDFRRLLGIAKGQYPAFMRLNEKVITPAMAEVNSVSDFRVTVEHQRHGRKVMALKFKMRRVVMLPEPAHTQAPLFPELDDMPALVRELTDAGLSTQDAFEIWQRGFGFVEGAVCPQYSGQEAEDAFAAYVREKIHLLKRRQSSGKVENSTGFLREAIRKNYANPEYEAEAQNEARQAAHKADAIAQKNAETVAEQKVVADRQRDKELQALYSGIIAENPALLDQAVAWAKAHAKGFDFAYSYTKTPAENYQDSVAVRAIINPYLERHVPERVAEITTQYAASVATAEG